MNAIGYLFIALAKMLHLIINIYTFIVVIAVIISWLRPDPYNPIVRMIHQITDPVLGRIRKWMPRALFRTGFDFSPIIVLLLLILIDTVVTNLLMDFGHSFFSQPLP